MFSPHPFSLANLLQVLDLGVQHVAKAPRALYFIQHAGSAASGVFCRLFIEPKSILVGGAHVWWSGRR